MADDFDRFKQLVESAFRDKKLSQTCYENLIKRKAIDLYELEHHYREFQHSVDNAEYYITLDRIAKGEELLASEQDTLKKSEYRKLLNDLTIKLDNLMPRGESA
jgi:hypothetical protein